MYRTKKDVDKHVENLISKLSVKEFKTRAYSVARLYLGVGDYASCQRYVEQYLTQTDNNAAAHKLLGQALHKLGQKEKALEQYRTSLDIDPTQTSTILDICELLADDEVTIDPGRAKYWFEKAEATFPRHPVTFRLRERLVTMANPNPEALIKLLKAELAVRPKDVVLHSRLLKHYIQTNKINEAFEHSCNVEFGGQTFYNNYTWYDTVIDILKHNSLNCNDWLYQLLLLTVWEHICVLSLTETPSGSSKSLIESSEHLHAYDQAIDKVSKAGPASGYGEFHAALLQHHRGQFAFHAATFLLKRGKRDQLSWREATRAAAPLMLIAWQTVPLDSKVNWLLHAPEKQTVAVHRWYTEGTYRCSQSGHYLLANIQDKSQSFLDKLSQTCSGAHWKDKLYERIFISRDHLEKIKSSHFVSNAYSTPVLRLPRRVEVEAYDVDAQRQHPNSLHHFVWTVMNYKNYAHFQCTLFDMLTPTATNCAPETLHKLDIQAFLYFATLTSHQQKSKDLFYASDKPSVLPANITDLLCSLSQMKWWDCVYKFSQNELGTELTDIRATLSRGIEVVRCVDNHGLDPELLSVVGGIFSERAKLSTAINEKNKLEARAGLYYSSALPLLEKLKSKIIIKMPEKRIFDYTHKELSSKDLNALIEESKLYVAINYLNDCEYDKVIELLSNLKCPEAYFHLSQTYKKLALEENNLSRENSVDTKSKYAALITKAKGLAYKALDKVKDTELNKNHPLYSDIQLLIEEIETHISKFDPDLSGNNDGDGKYSSDENISSAGSEHVPLRNNYHLIRNLSSTPKQSSNSILTNYRTAMDSQVLETTRAEPQFLEKIENQIKSFQKRLADDFMEQTKCWFEENRKLGNQIMNTIQCDIQNTNDQFKCLKISVDQVKDQIDECRNECKDVGDLKKQIAELKKEVNKLKKTSSEQTIDESDLYNLDDDYRTNESTSSFAAQMPFQAHVIPQFNQRMVPPFPVPPNPYQLYNQSLYNLYNQYSQFSQTPGAPPLFDAAKLGYAGVYPTPDQMYLDLAHLLVPPTVPPVPSVPSVPTLAAVPPLSTVPTTSVPPPVTLISTPKSTSAVNTIRSLPVNVVITSSDPLPTCTTAPAPVLSVTIPPKHIKGTPHNYQISMPSNNEPNVAAPPVFSFSTSVNKSANATTPSSLVNWNHTNIFKTSQPNSLNTTTNSLFNNSTFGDTIDKSVVDGGFTGTSPNNSLNKSRTLSERSNTSVENYDPCPDFKPIVPLPAEVKVTTGEEDEITIFGARAKLFRFVDKQWKERGIGEMKLLKHKETGKVRVLMRREQIHKICANHIILPEMEIKPMKTETKAYFWVANDFADETVVLEKFCIRFKTADIALQFYEAFEKARQDSGNNSSITEEISKINDGVTVKTPAKSVGNLSVDAKPAKTEFGGFTFSSTPTFKIVGDETKSDSKPSTPAAANKANVFSNLNFKSTTTSPFTNIFGATASPVTYNSAPASNASPAQKQDSSGKLNTSDVVEEFEPTVDFKPVIPLPALVEQKTGEEHETVLFEHRAKLLRFDASTKEWKERGLGNIKLLAHNDNAQKVRLLMRREQIMKVCCNHAVTKEMTFQKMPNMDKAVTWCAKDYSDGELVAETFCLRFKTVQICNDFIEALKSAQSKIASENKSGPIAHIIAKDTTQIGFGDKFKPKAGSWHCKECYTNNLESYVKCACCEQPKPKTDDNKTKSGTPATNWGDKFKPKPGTWECSLCLIRNNSDLDYCSACDSPKDPSMPKKETKLTSDTAPKFSFGIPTQIATTPSTLKKDTTPIPVATPVVTSGWGDKFKPKEGTWECKQCFVRNESNSENCSACNDSRNPNAIKPLANSVFGIPMTGPKFTFGIPPTSNVEPTPKTETTSIFDGTGAHKFSFGIPSNDQDKPPNVVSFGEPRPVVFSAAKAPNTNEGALNLSSNTINVATPLKPALLPTPQKESTPFGDKATHATFDFVFKPKTPPKGKSPLKSPKVEGDESDGEEYASEDEGHDIHFSPVIPLPEKIEVVTGEENETELYGHRAKLFRFNPGEWKERGIGVVKVLKHNDTGKLRVVMRREQVLKICLNHALTPEITYVAKDDKTWFFAANDFSEGELSLQQFCLRFKTKEIASEFKDAVDKARSGKPLIKDTECNKKETDNDDVVFINEVVATEEEKQKAKELMLPENFFTYKNKPPCKGCRGCKDEDVVKSISNIKFPAISNVLSSTSSTPVKSTVLTFQSPMNSFYGTPTNFDRTSDTSIFRTPLSSLGSNTNSASPATPTPSVNLATDKENTLTQKNIFGGADSPSVQGTPQSQPANIFGAGDAQNFGSSKTTILAAPKLSALNTSGGETQEAKPIFGNAPTKSVFGESKSIFGNAVSGLSSNKSIFGFSLDNKDDTEKSEVQSIFGGDSQKPDNLFTRASQGSVFGPAALGNSQQKSASGIFVATTPQQDFGTAKSIFGAAAAQTATMKFGDVTNASIPEPKREDKKPEENDAVVKEPPFKVDNSLSFAALSTVGSETGFTVQKKPDFKWAGAGEQLFTGVPKGGKDGDGSGAAGPDEEYDPHYEPIVPLPDKIEVTTGEEDEKKLFGERCKLYRYYDKTKEWKERGVGEMKILHHPEKNTYRLLLRREQIHKAVLNMLIFMDLELLPMNKSDRAWTWAGCNFAENPAGEQETLAVRFKSVDLAVNFRDKVVDCTRKLQAAAAQALIEEQEAKSVAAAPLRLPKHLESSARADAAFPANVESSQPTRQDRAGSNGAVNAEVFKQVTFQEPGEDQHDDEDDEDYEHDYDNEDYDGYYNEDEDESATYYECVGEAVITQGDLQVNCDNAHVHVLFDQDVCSPKILVTDSDTGEILADLLIHTDTVFQLDGDTCTWSGVDYTSNDPIDKMVSVNFHDIATAMQFYDSCETSKSATTFSSTDPEA